MEQAAKSTAESPLRTPAAEREAEPSESAGKLADMSPRGQRLSELASLVRGGPAAVAQRARLAGMFGAMGKSLERQPSGGAPVVQRKVTYFNAETTNLAPPKEALTTAILNSGQVEQQYIGEVKGKVDKELWSSGVRDIPTPNEITADIAREKVLPPARNSYYAGRVGNVGRDQFLLKTGNSEAFEGGHIIPHSLWDAEYEDAGMADHYNNLVPMSRTLNVQGWANRENELRERKLNLPHGEILRANVTIEREDSISLNIGNLVNSLDLTPSDDANQDSSVSIPNWLPTGLTLSYERIDEEEDVQSEGEFSQVGEEMHDTHTPIEGMSALRAELHNSQFRHRITADLWKRLNALDD